VSGQLEIKLRRAGTIYVIDIKGEMDLYNAFKLKDIVKAMIERSVKEYVINLEEVQYIDSSGIGSILFVYGEMKQRGMSLVVAGARGPVKRVIELTKLIGYLPLAADVTEALAKLREVKTQ
jgi:anti-sigma B factor antagonist